MGKPVFLNVIFSEIYFLGFYLRRYDTCQFGLLNNKKRERKQIPIVIIHKQAKSARSYTPLPDEHTNYPDKST